MFRVDSEEEKNVLIDNISREETEIREEVDRMKKDKWKNMEYYVSLIISIIALIAAYTKG